jgi:hypothetical protein
MNTLEQSPTCTSNVSKAVFNTPEAAHYIGRKPQTLHGWRGTGFGPKYVKQGRMIGYRVKDLDEWLAANTHG